MTVTTRPYVLDHVPGHLTQARQRAAGCRSPRRGRAQRSVMVMARSRASVGASRTSVWGWSKEPQGDDTAAAVDQVGRGVLGEQVDGVVEARAVRAPVVTAGGDVEVDRDAEHGARCRPPCRRADAPRNRSSAPRRTWRGGPSSRSGTAACAGRGRRSRDRWRRGRPTSRGGRPRHRASAGAPSGIRSAGAVGVLHLVASADVVGDALGQVVTERLGARRRVPRLDVAPAARWLLVCRSSRCLPSCRGATPRSEIRSTSDQESRRVEPLPPGAARCVSGLCSAAAARRRSMRRSSSA